MSATTLPPTSNTQEQALVEYRSVSKLALVALGLGLASALVLINPLLAPIPLLTIVLAAFSLRSIHQSGGQVVGRAPAIFGLCLATFFLGWGVAARFSRAVTLETHARGLADAWLKLVSEGDLQQADQLRLPGHNRMVSAAGRREFYDKNPDMAKSMDDFFATPPLREFVTQGKAAKYQFEALDSAERAAYFDRVVLRYSFGDPQAEGGRRSLLITVKREVHEDHTDWMVESVAGSDGPVN
jgi:hypothetical protein